MSFLSMPVYGTALPDNPKSTVEWTPRSVKFENLVGFNAYNLDENLPGITSLTLNGSLEQGCDFESCPDLLSISFPELTDLNGNSVYLRECPALQVADFPRLTHADNYGFNLSNCVALVRVSLPAFVTGKLNMSGNTSLADFVLPALVPAPNCTLDLGGSPLSSASTDQILNRVTQNLDTFQFNSGGGISSASSKIKLKAIESAGGNYSLGVVADYNYLNGADTSGLVECYGIVNAAGANSGGSVTDTSITFPNLTYMHGSGISGIPQLTSLAFPALTSGSIYLLSLRNLVTLSLPAVTNLSVFLSDCGLASLDLSHLQTSRSLYFSFCDLLTSIDLSGLVTCQGFNFPTGNGAINTMNLASWVPQNNCDFNLFGQNLAEATVNQILARCVAAVGFTSGNIWIYGGTTSAPTGQGLIDKATLLARGINLATN